MMTRVRDVSFDWRLIKAVGLNSDIRTSDNNSRSRTSTSSGGGLLVKLSLCRSSLVSMHPARGPDGEVIGP